MKRDYTKEGFNLDVVIDELSGSKLVEDYQQASKNAMVVDVKFRESREVARFTDSDNPQSVAVLGGFLQDLGFRSFDMPGAVVIHVARTAWDVL